MNIWEFISKPRTYIAIILFLFTLFALIMAIK
jgi:hypothetical protein